MKVRAAARAKQNNKQTEKMNNNNNRTQEFGLEHSLPANLEMEKLVLGVILLDNNVAGEAIDLLAIDDFHSPTFRAIFRAMRGMWGRVGIDPLTLIEELNRTQPDHGCDPAFIASLFDGVPRFTSIASYAAIIKQKATLRRAINLGNWMMVAGADPATDAEEYMARVQREVDQMVAERQYVDDLITSEEAVNRALVRLQTQWDGGGAILGMPCGLDALDARLKGIRPGKVYVIAGKPGMGKTTLALNWIDSFDRAAAECDKPVGLVITMEMTVEELEVKLMSVRTGISTDRIEGGYLSERERASLRGTASLLATMQAEYVEGFARITATSIRARAEQLRRKHNGRIDYLVLDYIQLVDDDEKPGGGTKTENAKLTEISRTLKRIAKQFNIPVIVLSQLNRTYASRSGGSTDPQLSDLRGSGSIEQDADVVIFITPHDNSDPDSALRKLITAKLRDGQTGTDLAVFSGARSRFMNIDAPPAVAERAPGNAQRQMYSDYTQPDDDRGDDE
jgi:replicative DNA helicase